MGAFRIIFLIILICKSIAVCKTKTRKLLQTIPQDYCETYCNGVCDDSTNQKTCDNEDLNFVITNEYTLILRDGYLEIKWSIPSPQIFNLTPINKISNVKLKELIVSDTYRKVRGVDYLRQLGVETVTRFEKQLNTFEAIERNVHHIDGPRSLILNFENMPSFSEITDYVKGSMNNINEIKINRRSESGNKTVMIDENIFEGKPNITSLTFTGLKIENLTPKTFSHLSNLKQFVLSKCTIKKLSFINTLEKSLEHLVLDINNEVDMKSFKNFSMLKLIKVQNYIPYEKLTALTCNQSWCNFIRGTNGIVCPGVCDCRYIYDELELKINCSNRGLSLIPPLPTPIIGVVNLIFHNNSLSRLPNNTLPGYITLKKLDVSRNTLTSLSIIRLPTKLDYLDISFNKIVEMNTDIIEYIKHVTIFKQTGNEWIAYCDDEPLLHLFKILKMIIRMRKVEVRPIFVKLSSSHKGFMKFLGQHFLSLGVKKQSYFLIYEDQVVTSMLQKLNKLNKIMSIFKYMEWFHKNLAVVNNEYELFYYHKMAVACPYKCECCHRRATQTLKIDCSNKFVYNFPDVILKNRSFTQKDTMSNQLELHLSNNNISKITIDMLPEILRYLDLRNNSLETLDDKVTRYLKEFKNLSEVKLSGNPWNCDCKSRSILSFLRDNEALEYNLTLGRCNISRADCPDACVCCLDSSTSSSVIIDCNGEGLRRIPELSMKVTYVDLSNNNITAFTEKDRSFFAKRSLHSPLKLVLLNNPWSCTCKDIENINFMKSISSSIVDFTEISCSTGLKVVSIDQDVICPSGFAYYLALAISLAAVVVAINFMICFRQPLLVWFYEHDVCLSLAARRELDQEKKFDAFLAFTHKDEALVEEFVEKLELGKPRFRLCFYLRDWLVGESIPDCIGRSVRDSRRIIILMTDNFIRSTWGRLEFRLALHATSQDRCKRLIVVLYPDVRNFDSLDSELRAYMVFNTYLERSHPNFWNKLIYSMPHAKLRQGHPI
ncbi:toll-like receptor Tollo [Drosophila gunungcola]|uniref:toll-like receptor Tollo n=1 Tax=Drosophila gunungcola TaxID=103775 RepID=UPI0022E85C12|nr:toll-like receptor Tollo [Drosophila gunungcola]